MPREVRKVGVIGLGAMGSGIAQLCVEAGIDVVGHEVTLELAERARDRVAGFLARKVEKGELGSGADSQTVARLSLTDELADLAECDFVLEAIVEELEPKQELFRDLEAIVDRSAILATNTSALSVTEIASATETPERVVGMHFFNPAPLMPLVEIVRAELSSEDAVDTTYALAERIGKTPIRCHDTPGFVVNRVLIPVLNDCVRVLDERGSPRKTSTQPSRAASAGRWARASCSTSSESMCKCTRPRRCSRSSASRAWRRRRDSSRWRTQVSSGGRPVAASTCTTLRARRVSPIGSRGGARSATCRRTLRS